MRWWRRRAKSRLMNEADSISRRDFLTRLGALAALGACYPAAPLAQLRVNARAAAVLDWPDTDPWKTLAAVQDHLFPVTEDAPGASDIGAIVYLRNTLENPDADGADREFMLNGVGWLGDLARERYKQPFTALDETQRETLLRQIEDSRAGRRWLSKLLTWILEALLADPVYGGNPNGIGWKWLEHQPGFPAPPANRTWYRLAASRDDRKA